ncbi:helix-turn-helix domain-containing protein [Microbispora sp. NPDC049633]|uniref:helix-turn-helix domain-containing protein n=1 Tax=Microbispora sp. NPDC049633 TaxID=3154355 RepID=UPI0034200251
MRPGVRGRPEPLQWLLNQRLSLAQSLLESTGLPIARIGELSGLGTANNLRYHFLKQVGVSPGEYRRAFPERHPTEPGPARTISARPSVLGSRQPHPTSHRSLSPAGRRDPAVSGPESPRDR